jgi:signal transduction histidine kinase
MNHMLDEIQHLVAECKSMGDDIARDLCTPLTRIRARLDRGHSSVGTTEEAHGLIDASIADLDITFGIMTTLLRIGEIESGRRRAGFREVDLAEIALEVGEIYAPMAEAIPLSLDIRTPCTAPMLGDRDLLVEALANLVTNAIKVTPPSGHITIAVDATPAGPALSVSDTGPGMPLSVREFVLRRFNRGGTAPHMPGGGLGLCLVASITRLHDLHLAIESGPGCVFKLLPTRACTS